MKRILPFAALALVLFGAIYLWGQGPGRAPMARSSAPAAGAPAAGPADLPIDLDKAVAVALPKTSASLTPVSFTTPDGRSGWVVRFPGLAGFASLPIPTPAYDLGKLFVGGGFGSSQFYALNATTGDVIWQRPTADDGPTSAAVDHGNVAFNTQSCSLMVMDENNGVTLWKKWLGDPLVSQPAVSHGRVYASSPNNASSAAEAADSLAMSSEASDVIAAPAGQAQSEPVTGYALTCAGVTNGKTIWKKPIPQEVISAPVVSGQRMYMACYDGTLSCLRAKDGATIWSRSLGATSAPVVADGRVLVTVRRDRGGMPYEGILRLNSVTGRVLDGRPIALEPAEYLQNGRGCTSIDPSVQQSLDGLEGFSGGLPTTVQVGDTGDDDSFGIDTVTGAWAYEGSRVAMSGKTALDAQGAYVNAVSAGRGRLLWRALATGADAAPGSQVFSPPALGAHCLYLCSGRGDLVCLDQATGRVRFAYHFGQPVSFQPMLAGGNVYVATSNGLLICLKTGSADADGWYDWGGNAQHDKAG